MVGLETRIFKVSYCKSPEKETGGTKYMKEDKVNLISKIIIRGMIFILLLFSNIITAPIAMMTAMYAYTYFQSDYSILIIFLLIEAPFILLLIKSISKTVEILRPEDSIQNQTFVKENHV